MVCCRGRINFQSSKRSQFPVPQIADADATVEGNEETRMTEQNTGFTTWQYMAGGEKQRTSRSVEVKDSGRTFSSWISEVVIE